MTFKHRTTQGLLGGLVLSASAVISAQAATEITHPGAQFHRDGQKQEEANAGQQRENGFKQFFHDNLLIER